MEGYVVSGPGGETKRCDTLADLVAYLDPTLCATASMERLRFAAGDAGVPAAEINVALAVAESGPARGLNLSH